MKVDQIKQGDVYRLEALENNDFYDIFVDLYSLKKAFELHEHDEFMILDLKKVNFTDASGKTIGSGTYAQIIVVGQEKLGWIVVEYRGAKNWSNYWTKIASPA